MNYTEEDAKVVIMEKDQLKGSLLKFLLFFLFYIISNSDVVPDDKELVETCSPVQLPEYTDSSPIHPDSNLEVRN